MFLAKGIRGIKVKIKEQERHHNIEKLGKDHTGACRL
jgi:hypothetical protein